MNKANKCKINKKQLEKAEWDSTITDVNAYKATAEEILARKLSHQSKNQMLHFHSQSIESDKQESVYDRLTKTRYGNKLKLNDINQRKDILKDMFIPDRELFELFSQSEKALSNVECMFGDHKKRFKAIPSVTLAPEYNIFSKDTNNSNGSALNNFSDSDDDRRSSKTDDQSLAQEDDLTKFRKFIEKEKQTNNVLYNKLEEKRTVLIDSIKKFEVSTETDNLSSTSNGILEYISSRMENRDVDRLIVEDSDRIISDRIIDHFEKLDKQKQEELTSLRSELSGCKELIDALTLELINNSQQMKRMKSETESFMKTVTVELSQMKSYVIKYFDQRQPQISAAASNNDHYGIPRTSLADQLFKENFNFENQINDQQQSKDQFSLTEQFQQLQFDQDRTQRRLDNLMKVQKSLSQMAGDYD